MRFCLDVLLFVFITTFFKCHLISVDYHVWGGLVFFGFSLWHVWLNRKWLMGFGRRKKGWRDWGNMLFLLVWLAMIVTGILCARQLGIGWFFLKPWHKFLGAISLLLLAFHISCHWAYLRENILRRCPPLRKVPHTLGAALLAGTLCFGFWSFADSGFGKWISAPFVASSPLPSSGDGSGRKKHQTQPFNPAKVSKYMAESAAMIYACAYMMRKKQE